jgi:hypothetical protein
LQKINKQLRIIDPAHSIRTPADAFLEYYINNMSHHQHQPTDKSTSSGGVDDIDVGDDIEDLDCEIEDLDLDRGGTAGEDTDTDSEIGEFDCIVEDLL